MHDEAEELAKSLMFTMGGIVNSNDVAVLCIRQLKHD